MINIHPLNESYVKIDCEPSYMMEISDELTFNVPGARFMPKFKAGIWDGKIRLVDRRFGTTYKGLVPYIIKLCSDRDYKVNLSKKLVFPFKDTIDFSWDSLKLPEHLSVRDYQRKAVNIALTKKRRIIVSPTASGKSLIIYAICRALQGKKILIVVPTINLVDQMYNDFNDYAQNSSWSSADNVHKIYSGKEKNTTLPITVSTWQSIWKKGKEYFSQFDCVIGDEVHTFDAKACTSIMEKSTNAFYRFGFTGTLKECKTHKLSLTGLFGPVTNLVSTKELMDRDLISKMKIHAIQLKYSERHSKPVRKMKYHDEIDYIVTLKKRNEVLKNLVKTRNGNTLVLFNFIDKHGKQMYDLFTKELNDKEVHFIYGGTPADQREQIKQLVSKRNDIVILASYGVFSTGINAPNIQNVVLSSPTKSKIRILQSIGRGLRKAEGKTRLNVFDIADDFRGKYKSKNFALKHFLSRYDMYNKEGFDIKLHIYPIK